MSDNNTASGGIGFIGLLTILFIGLKLTGYINWSWLWVLSPIWISFVFVIAILLIVGIIWVISEIVKDKRRKRLRTDFLNKSGN